MPAPVPLVDPRVATRDEGERPDEEEEDDEGDLHACILAKRYY